MTGPFPTKMGNMNKLCKLLCTHCLNSLMDIAFCMIICTYLLWIYDLNMESVNWSNYLTTCKSCGFLILKGGCICIITNLRVHFPLKWEIWMNFVRYCVHIVSTLHWILYFVWLFVYLSYEYMIWRWRVLTDQNIKWYIQNKDIQMIIQNTKSSEELIKFVHNNLQSSFRFPISVGSGPVRSLNSRDRSSLKWESHKTCNWWDILIS